MSKTLANLAQRSNLLPGFAGAALLSIGVGLFDYRLGLVVAGVLLLALDRRMP